MKNKYQEYFNYYLELERDFYTIESFLTIEEDNYEAFSVKFVSIYQSVCSEIDCLLKEICKQINPNSKVSNINECFDVISPHFNFFQSEV